MIAAALLVAGSLVVFYILAGYPLLLAFGHSKCAPPVRKDPEFRPTVSVIMAVYNGERFLRAKLDSLLALDYPGHLVDIVVVSDGSSDQTDAIAAEYAGPRVRLLRVPHAGKAAALNAGLRTARGEILFFTDVRQPLDRHALRHLTANFADPSVGAVTGEMRLFQPDSGEQADMDLYWRYEVWARTRHSRIYSLLNTTGCIYALRRSLAEPIPPDTLTDDQILPLRGFFRGFRIIFEPQAIAFDYPAVPGAEFRRRFRTLAGLWQTCRRMPRLFTSSNRMRFHFLSHKVGRLMLPWAIVLVYAATIALPASGFRDFLLADEAALLLLALADYAVPAKWTLKRISSPAKTFVLMNVAALISLCVLFLPASRLWKPTRVR